MQRLEVSGVVRLTYRSLGVKGLKKLLKNWRDYVQNKQIGFSDNASDLYLRNAHFEPKPGHSLS